MCYARRQRSSWARIKLSSKLYLNRFRFKSVCRACLALILFRVCLESVIDSRFLFQRNSRFFRTNFACTFISCCSIVNDLCKALASLRCFSHSLAIIPHSLALVKGFSKTFFKNFQAPLSVGGSALTLYHIPLSLSRGFSKVFSTFFRDPLSCRPLPDSPAVWQLAYYSTFFFICQAVFDKFFCFGNTSTFTQTKHAAVVHIE